MRAGNQRTKKPSGKDIPDHSFFVIAIIRSIELRYINDDILCAAIRAESALAPCAAFSAHPFLGSRSAAIRTEIAAVLGRAATSPQLDRRSAFAASRKEYRFFQSYARGIYAETFAIIRCDAYFIVDIIRKAVALICLRESINDT